MVARHQGLREENRENQGDHLDLLQGHLENQDVHRDHLEKGARLAAHDSRIP